MTAATTCLHPRITISTQNVTSDGYQSVGACVECNAVVSKVDRHSCGGRWIADQHGVTDECSRCHEVRA